MVVIVNCKNCLMVRIKYLLVSNDHILMTFFFFFFFSISKNLCALFKILVYIMLNLFTETKL
jgi:hypothetical protein